MHNFATGEVRIALIQLRDGNLDECRPMLERRVRENQEDLAAYLGAIQTSAAYRKAERARLETLFSTKTASWLDNFQLAAVSLDDTGEKMRFTDRQALLSHAARLAARAWKARPEPVVGLLFADIAHRYRECGVTPESILERLVKDLSGARACSVYRAAERNQWRSALPEPNLVPAQHRRSLAGVLKSVRSRATSYGARVKEINGKTTLVTVPTSEINVRKGAYLKRWIEQLERDNPTPAFGSRSARPTEPVTGSR